MKLAGLHHNQHISHTAMSQTQQTSGGTIQIGDTNHTKIILIVTNHAKHNSRNIMHEYHRVTTLQT